MKLGAFSISLNVADLQVSKAFYTQLGFVQSGGDMDQGYVIMKNGDTLIGLFAGFIESNTLTFNPGWDQHKQDVPDFVDVREIQTRLKSAGLELAHECDTTTKGPAYITLFDPDGNAILIDQHR